MVVPSYLLLHFLKLLSKVMTLLTDRHLHLVSVPKKALLIGLNEQIRSGRLQHSAVQRLQGELFHLHQDTT